MDTTLTLSGRRLASTQDMTLRGWTLLVLASCTINIAAQPHPRGILGNWREPLGSVIEVFPCGADICARMVAISPQAPTRFDIHNPAPDARKHPLCGLQIGYGFHLGDPSHADGGKLYDPKSGKTYRGTMTADSDQLHLRGYVGIKAFGRSETWTRATQVAACAAVHS